VVSSIEIFCFSLIFFSKVICSHEHFVGLNAHGHVLVSILIRTVLDQQRSADKAVRLLAMTALRNLLLKLAFDSRYQSSKLRGRVSGLFFSFVVMLVKDREQFWERYNLEEKRTTLFCFLYILSSSSSSLVLQFWKQSDAAATAGFFGLLCRALLTFEYRGLSHVVAMSREFTAMKLSRLKQQLATSPGAALKPETDSNTTTPVPALKLEGEAEGAGLRSWKKKASPRSTATEADAVAGGEGGSLRSWRIKAGGTSPRVKAAHDESPVAAPPSSDSNLRSWRVKVLFL
jgi:hypothetical protein